MGVSGDTAYYIFGGGCGSLGTIGVSGAGIVRVPLPDTCPGRNRPRTRTSVVALTVLPDRSLNTSVNGTGTPLPTS